MPRDKTRRRVQPTQPRAQASVEAILEAAEQLLEREGFQAMTTNRIAERAGVNVSLVYRYFAAKEAIVGTLVERYAERTFDSVVSALREHAEAPLEQVLAVVVRTLARTPGLSPEVHRELVEQVGVTRRREVVQRQREGLRELFRSFLEERGPEVRPLADREATLFAVEHLVEAGTHAAAFYRPDGLSEERALGALTEMLVRTLVAR